VHKKHSIAVPSPCMVLSMPVHIDIDPHASGVEI